MKVKVEILRDFSNIPTKAIIHKRKKPFVVEFDKDSLTLTGTGRDMPNISEIIRMIYPVQIEPLPVGVRDVKKDYALSANKTVNFKDDFNATGLDIFIHNRGASSLTFSVDGGDSITVNAGDTFSQNDIEFNEVIVTSAVDYDLKVAGIKFQTQQRTV